jgi:hypothetical protein
MIFRHIDPQIPAGGFSSPWGASSFPEGSEMSGVSRRHAPSSAAMLSCHPENYCMITCGMLGPSTNFAQVDHFVSECPLFPWRAKEMSGGAMSRNRHDILSAAMRLVSPENHMIFGCCGLTGFFRDSTDKTTCRRSQRAGDSRPDVSVPRGQRHEWRRVGVAQSHNRTLWLQC